MDMDEVEPSPLFDFHAQLIKVRNSVHTQEHIHQNTKALPPQKLPLWTSGNQSTRRRTLNSPTPTRRLIKSSRDVGELVVNPIQLIRS